jgi:hypothetical protein
MNKYYFIWQFLTKILSVSSVFYCHYYQKTSCITKFTWLKIRMPLLYLIINRIIFFKNKIEETAAIYKSYQKLLFDYNFASFLLFQEYHIKENLNSDVIHETAHLILLCK